MFTLIVTAKRNEIDPKAWLADVLKRLPDMPITRVDELRSWQLENRTGQCQCCVSAVLNGYLQPATIEPRPTVADSENSQQVAS